MIKSILVPLDGSPFAEQALPWAACLAKVCGAHLELVRVHDPVPPWTIATEGAVAATTVDPTIRDAEEQYLANCAARLEEGGFAGVTRKLIEGDVVEQIACHAEDNAFGLVVLATHGRGAISRLWLGSVSDALVRRLTVPVLLIRPTEGTAVPRAERFRKVFVALDGSTESESAIAPALALADPKGCEVVLLRVVPAGPDRRRRGHVRRHAIDDTLTKALVEQAETYLEGVAARLREADGQGVGAGRRRAGGGAGGAARGGARRRGTRGARHARRAWAPPDGARQRRRQGAARCRSPRPPDAGAGAPLSRAASRRRGHGFRRRHGTVPA